MRVTWYDLVTPVRYGHIARRPGLTWWQLAVVTAVFVLAPAVVVHLAIRQLRELEGTAVWVCSSLALVAAVLLFRYILTATVEHERAVRAGRSGPQKISRGLGLAVGMVTVSVAPLLPPEAAFPAFAGAVGGVAPLTLIFLLRLPGALRQMREPA